MTEVDYQELRNNFKDIKASRQMMDIFSPTSARETDDVLRAREGNQNESDWSDIDGVNGDESIPLPDAVRATEWSQSPDTQAIIAILEEDIVEWRKKSENLELSGAQRLSLQDMALGVSKSRAKIGEYILAHQERVRTASVSERQSMGSNAVQFIASLNDEASTPHLSRDEMIGQVTEKLIERDSQGSDLRQKNTFVENPAAFIPVPSAEEKKAQRDLARKLSALAGGVYRPTESELPKEN